MVTDNTPGAVVNPGFKDGKGAQEAFSSRPRARSYTMVTMDALLAGMGSIEFPSERATVLWLSLGACPLPKN